MGSVRGSRNMMIGMRMRIIKIIIIIIAISVVFIVIFVVFVVAEAKRLMGGGRRESKFLEGLAEGEVVARRGGGGVVEAVLACKGGWS